MDLILQFNDILNQDYFEIDVITFSYNMTVYDIQK